MYFEEQNKDFLFIMAKLLLKVLKPIHFAHYVAALASVGDTATIREIYEDLGGKTFN